MPESRSRPAGRTTTASGITGRTAREIVASVENAVGAGAYPPGAALPAVRTLATELGVSPSTVAAAYRMLQNRSVVEVKSRRTVVLASPGHPPFDPWWLGHPKDAVLLSTAKPDKALLPVVDSEVLDRVIRRHGDRLHNQSGPTIIPELQAAMREWFSADGVNAEHLLLTHGHFDGISRGLATALRPGDRVAVEDPGVDGLLRLLAARGLFAVGVGVDDDGPRPEALASALDKDVRAVIITDRAQHPTGAAITADRRSALQDVLASRRDVLLIEHDPGLGAATMAPCPLAGSTDRWLLTRTFDNAFGGDIRLAVTTGDGATIGAMARMQTFDSEWISRILQCLALELWQSAQQTVALAAQTYEDRRQHLIKALEERGVTAHGRTGIEVWVPLPKDSDEMGVVIRLMQEKWIVAPSRPFTLAGGPGIRITVSQMRPTDVEPFCDALVQALQPRH